MPGYPDYQTYPQWTGANMLAGLAMNYPTGVAVLYAGPAPAFASLHLRIGPATGFGSVTVVWSLDAAFTEQVGTDNFNVTFRTALFAVVPVEAPYVRVSVSVTSVAAMTGAQYMTGTNVAAAAPTTRTTPQTLHPTAVSVAASATSDSYIAFLMGGHGNLYIAPADAAGKLNFALQVVDQSDALQWTLFESDAPAAPASAMVHVPVQIVRLRVTNTDAAAAHSYSASLVVVP